MFSIIIPAYNEEEYLTPCLKSVLALKKTLPFEVIVVNNASTDRTPEIVKEILPQAKLINEPRKGLTRAYNRGAKEAKGDVLVFVDADMILSPNHLERIAREFENNPKLVVLSGPYLYQDGGKFCELMTRFVYLCLAMPAELFFNRFLNFAASIASGNCAVKKEAFERIGGFNEDLFYGLETDFATRALKVGKVRFKYYLGTESSARRHKKEGTFLTIFRHIFNIVWICFFKKPFTKGYTMIR